MSSIDEDTNDTVYSWPTPDQGSYLQVRITEEGLIFDVVENGEVVATMGMMAQEWADYIKENSGIHQWGTKDPDDQLEVDIIMRKIKARHDTTNPPYIFHTNKNLPFPSSTGTIEEILREVWRVAFANATEVVFQHFKEKSNDSAA